MVGGRDAADVPFEVTPAQAVYVVVTFTTRVTRLTGTLLHRRRSAGSGYDVVAFADDPAQWTTG